MDRQPNKKDQSDKDRYVLGLDLGTNSLGYAVIRYPKEGKPTLHNGVDIFNAGKSKIGQGVTQETSNNQERRQSRQMRRQYYRKRLRKQHLLALLIRYDLCPLQIEELDRWRKWDPETKSKGQKFPDTPEFREWLRLNPYELRAKAVDGETKLTRHEFGRILYALIQRRGFVSGRKSSDEGKIFEGKEGMTGINETKKNLNGRTLGTYLYDIGQKDGEEYDDSTTRIRARYTLREMYVDEFDRIWDAQAEQLGLADEQIHLRHRQLIKGNPSNKHNTKRRQALEAKHGKVSIEEGTRPGTFYFVFDEVLRLREHLGGTLMREEDGTLRHNSRDSVLFWQRPLRSQKGLLGVCSFEGERIYDSSQKRWIQTGPTVIPVSHPVFELYRALQQLLQIRVNSVELPQAVMQDALEVLCSNKTKSGIKCSALKRKLKLTGSLNYDDDYSFSTCPTTASISSLLVKAPAPAPLQDGILTVPFDIDLYTRIWHKLYTFDDNHLLAESLRRMEQTTEGVHFVNDLEEKVAAIKVEEGYGHLSHHAIQNILPFLLRMIPHYESSLLGGIRNALQYKRSTPVEVPEQTVDYVINSLHDENRSRGETIGLIIKHLKDPSYPIPVTASPKKLRRLLYHPSVATTVKEREWLLPPVENLRNPLVEQALWALRRRVNRLIHLYAEKTGDPAFAFDEIHIELARELKMGVSARQERLRRQRENEVLNAEARDIIRGYGLVPSRENLQKYKLFRELADRNNGVVLCPYSGQPLTLYNVLSDQGEVEIEHIIPRSVSHNDSISNKTLCLSWVNREKGNLTPFRFYERSGSHSTLWGASSWEEVKRRARKLLPYPKYKLFTTEQSNIELQQGFSTSQLTDTAYMSRKAKEYLTSICDEDSIINVSGGLTAELRGQWGLNSLLDERPRQIPQELAASARLLPGERIPTTLLVDSASEEVLEVRPTYQPQPDRQPGDFIVRVTKKGRQLVFKNFPMAFPTLLHEELRDGEYYLRIKNPTPTYMEERYNRFPRDPDTDQLIIEFEVRNNNKLYSTDVSAKMLDNLLPYIPEASGRYWLTLPVIGWKLIPANAQVRGENTIQCNGRVSNQHLSTSPFYTNQKVNDTGTNVRVAVNYITEGRNIIKKLKPLPEYSDNECIITGQVKDELFTSEQDLYFTCEAPTFPDQACNCTLIFDPADVTFTPYLTEPLSAGRDQELVTGELTRRPDGTLIFNSEKNRDDHRHHGIDAAVIALASRVMYRDLSTYYARKDKLSKDSSVHPLFGTPWEDFREDLKRATDQILVNHQQNKKVLSNGKKTIVKNGEKYTFNRVAVRGSLHNDTFYGKRKNPKTKAEAYHKRVKIQAINTKEHIDSIADDTIRKIIEEHLKDLGVNLQRKDAKIPTDAFYKDGNYRIYLPNKNGDPVPVKRVRTRTSSNTMIQLKKDNKYVEPNNNHRVVLQKKKGGKKGRKQYNVQIDTFKEEVDHLLKNSKLTRLEDSEVVLELYKQDLVVFDMSREQLQHYIDLNDYTQVVNHLYVTTSLSSDEYIFWLHTSATQTEKTKKSAFDPARHFLISSR